MCNHPKWTLPELRVVEETVYNHIKKLVQCCAICGYARQVELDKPRVGYWCYACNGSVTYDGKTLACRNSKCKHYRAYNAG